MSYDLERDLEREIDGARRMSDTLNWTSSSLTLVAALSTGAATIFSAFGPSTTYQKIVAAVLAALPGVLIGIQRTQRLEARKNWHKELQVRLEAILRDLRTHGSDEAAWAKSFTDTVLEMEARWQATSAKDGGGGVDVPAPTVDPEVKARMTTATQQLETSSAAVHEILRSPELVKKLTDGLDEAAVLKLLEGAATDAAKAAKRASEIEVRYPDGAVKGFPLAAAPTFGALCDVVYDGAHGLFPIFSYGARWELVDAKTKLAYKHARQITRAASGRVVRDTRTLDEMGIRPGDVLEVRLLEPPAKR